MIREQITQREISKYLEIDESRISDILKLKIESFTLDRLLTYVAKIHADIKVLITAT